MFFSSSNSPGRLVVGPKIHGGEESDKQNVSFMKSVISAEVLWWITCNEAKVSPAVTR
jgi:hypothetical protein